MTEVVENVEPVKAEETKIVDDGLPKVFIGNLHYSINEDELTELFKEFGIIKYVKLPQRYGRRQGYGFVAFEEAEVVPKVIEALNQKDVKGRNIHVSEAKPQEPRDLNAPRPRGRGRGRGRGGRRGTGDRKSKATQTENGDATEVAETTEVAEGTETEPKVEGEVKKSKPKKKNNKKPKVEGEAKEGEVKEGEATEGGVKEVQEKKVKERKPKTPKERGPISNTIIHVRNLPFKFKEDDLKAIFSGFRVKSHSVFKGYGFVEAEDADEQQKILSELGQVEVDGRVVKIRQAFEKVEKSKAEEAVAAE